MIESATLTDTAKQGNMLAKEAMVEEDEFDWVGLLMRLGITAMLAVLCWWGFDFTNSPVRSAFTATVPLALFVLLGKTGQVDALED